MVRRPGWIVMGLVVSGSLLTATLGVGPRSAEAFTHTPAPVFINEIHYDNDGTDTNEAIEIAGPAGTDLTGWSVVPYNGNGGAPYAPTVPLAGVIPDQHAGFGTLSFSVPGLQNGAPDGLTLVNAGGTVVQCLSYEGTFTAVGGPATGLVSTDMGVAEAGTEPADVSLQLTGTGTTYHHFTWSSSAQASFGVVNGGQTFGSNAPSPRPNVSPLPSSTPAPAAAPSPATTRIRDIQGAAQSSPLAGQTVTNVPGIVTAVRSTGFYFQDGQPDTDQRTAEAVFVFTRTAPTVPAGASVLVSGMVSEFRPGSSGGTDNLTTTQLRAC